MPEEVPIRAMLAELDQLADAYPGCQVYRQPDDHGPCAAVSAAYVQCMVAHTPRCQYFGMGRFMTWMCEEHLAQAAGGILSCHGCRVTVVMLQVL